MNTLLKEYHYYAAGRKLTSVYETKSQFTKSASGQYVGPPINNHFIVLIPRKDGTVVEVDTMKDKAIIRGTWLKEVIKVIVVETKSNASVNYVYVFAYTGQWFCKRGRACFGAKVSY